MMVMGQHRRCGCVDVLASVIDGGTVDGNNGSGDDGERHFIARRALSFSRSLALSNYDDGRRRSVEEPLAAS